MMDDLEEKEKHLNSLSVDELIEILNTFPKERKGYVTWESTVNELNKEFIYESLTGSIYIDGDYGFYKKDFEKSSRLQKDTDSNECKAILHREDGSNDYPPLKSLIE